MVAFALPMSSPATTLLIPPAGTVGGHAVIAVEADIIDFAGGEILRVKVCVVDTGVADAADTVTHISSLICSGGSKFIHSTSDFTWES
jgi:hypothetical protein